MGKGGSSASPSDACRTTSKENAANAPSARTKMSRPSTRMRRLPADIKKPPPIVPTTNAPQARRNVQMFLERRKNQNPPTNAGRNPMQVVATGAPGSGATAYFIVATGGLSAGAGGGAGRPMIDFG